MDAKTNLQIEIKSILAAYRHVFEKDGFWNTAEAENAIQALIKKKSQYVLEQSQLSDREINKQNLGFGHYVTIEQKRYGADNEMFVYKVVGQLESNCWVDVPVQSHVGEVLHDSVEPVIWAICCGVQETEVRKYRISDVTILKPTENY